jgi:hypothetical protein
MPVMWRFREAKRVPDRDPRSARGMAVIIVWRTDTRCRVS